jgi:hypothetical protein
MKVILSILALLACVAAILWYWSTGRPGPTPFAEQVPPNAILYFAVPDLPAWLDDLNDHPRWKEALPVKPFLARVEENRAHLAGPGALFAVLKNDRLEWTSLVRLKNGKTHVEGTPYEGSSSMADRLDSHGNDDPVPLLVINLEMIPRRFRDLRGDFSLAVLKLSLGDELVISGRLHYRGGAYRDILENRVHAAPVVHPGEAPIAVSGLTNINDLWTLLGMDPSIPEYDRDLLGPAWGVQFRTPDDLAFWFDLSGRPLHLDGAAWKDFETRVEGSRWSGYTKRPPVPGPRSKHHEIIHLEMPKAAAVFRGRFGDRGDPLLEWLERFRTVESRLTYGGEHAAVSVTFTLP